jgi:mandelate racemase
MAKRNIQTFEPGSHCAGAKSLTSELLTIKCIRARPLLLKLERPIVARIATISDWPVILVDLLTNEGVVGRSYIEPYAPQAMKYIIAAIEDLGELLQGRQVAPADIFEAARKLLHFVGYQGLSMIAVSGLDMAAWDALAKAANLPLCVLLGGAVGPVKAYNSNGLWLSDLSQLGDEAAQLIEEGGFSGLKIRLGRATAEQDLRAIEAVRAAVGSDVSLMVDYNQGLDLADALLRCSSIDGLGLEWIEEPIVYDNLDGYALLASQLKTPLQLGENFYGARDLHRAIQMKACDLVMPDFMRIGGVTGWLRSAAIAAASGVPISTHLYPEVAAHVMRFSETRHWLECQNWVNPILKQPYEVYGGMLQIPPLAGVGIEWDEDAVS